MHHAPQDRQSLLLHEEAVVLIQRYPSLAQRALATLARWKKQSSRAQPLWDEWADIISSRDWQRALEISERGNERRQASPKATLLREEARLRIIREIRLEQRWLEQLAEVLLPAEVDALTAKIERRDLAMHRLKAFVASRFGKGRWTDAHFAQYDALMGDVIAASKGWRVDMRPRSCPEGLAPPPGLDPAKGTEPS